MDAVYAVQVDDGSEGIRPFLYDHRRMDLDPWCEKTRATYDTPKSCDGIDMPNPHTEDLKMDVIDSFVVNQFSMSSDPLRELVCTWDKNKITLMDFDYFPDVKDTNEHEMKAMFLRHIIRMCGIRVLMVPTPTSVGGKEITSVYYHKDLWKRALLMSLYEKKLVQIPTITSRVMKDHDLN